MTEREGFAPAVPIDTHNLLILNTARTAHTARPSTSWHKKGTNWVRFYRASVVRLSPLVRPHGNRDLIEYVRYSGHFRSRILKWFDKVHPQKFDCCICPSLNDGTHF